ncbi:MAG TPA: C-type lectin domain-containing protein [Labilithrix sp.]|nr:C-type lectin domain-containing protein [Labilithrix sp.]
MRLLVLASAIAGALALAAACLPDLAPISVEPTPFDAAGPFVGCGDGVIAALDDGGDAGESCDPGKPNDVDAQAPGCKACQITCEGVSDPRTGHCYFATTPSDGYSGALTSCKTAGAHVVTFASAAEAALVQGVSGAGAAEGFWVGLSRNSNLNENYGPDPSRAEEPGYPFPRQVPPPQGPCEGCFGVGADPDGGVFPIEDGGGSAPRCLASRGGTWFQVACSGTVRTTICEREPVGTRATTCFGGYCFTLPSTTGQKSYLVSFVGADPDQARQTCAQLDGGSLVVLDSAEEREQLAHEIILHDDTIVQQDLWIGLVKDAGAWSWEDGVPLTSGSRPRPWGNRQPSPSASGRAFMRLAATAYDTQLAYADESGPTPRLFVCQRSPQ